MHIIDIQRRQWQPTRILLPGESHGRRSLVVQSRTRLKRLSSPLTKMMEKKKTATIFLSISSFPYRVCVCVYVSYSVMSDCNPMDYNFPGFSVHGIFQARILEWVAICFSRGSSEPKDWTLVSWIAGRFFTTWPSGKPHTLYSFLNAIRYIFNYLILSFIPFNLLSFSICLPGLHPIQFNLSILLFIIYFLI